jgi:ribonuclease D
LTDKPSPERADVEETPLLSKPRRPVIFVDDAEQLSNAIGVLANHAGAFALDAERASGFKYSQRAYLIQVCRGNSPIFLIDPASISPVEHHQPFAELATLLASDLWILHAATQDIPCLARLGIRPTSLFDTELASRLVGLERVGLGAVCELLLGIRLAKEHSAVDWSIRPLQEEWLDYAALDVDVLDDLKNAIQERLEMTNKTDWAAEEFDYLTRFEAKPPKADKWRSTSGIGEIKDTKTLAVLRSLWMAREELAIKLDVSPGRLVPDSALIAACVAKPKSRPELATLRSFHGRASRSYIDTWWTAIAAGYEDRDPPVLRPPATGIPNHRNWPNRFPEADARLQAARPVISALAEEIEMPAENLISPDYVRQVCWHIEITARDHIANKLQELGARDWQIRIVAEALAQAFDSSSGTTSDVDPETDQGS